MSRRGRPDRAARASTGLRTALVIADWNRGVTARLGAGARGVLRSAGAREIVEVRVPGSFELAAAAEAAARSGRFDAVVCLGCVLRGDTRHHIVVGDGAVRGIEAAARSHAGRIAFGMGVLTVDTLAQAMERSGRGSSNAGATAARAALAMHALFRRLGH